LYQAFCPFGSRLKTASVELYLKISYLEFRYYPNELDLERIVSGSISPLMLSRSSLSLITLIGWAVSKIKVIAGDFSHHVASRVVGNELRMQLRDKIFAEKIPLSEIAELDVASKESVTRIGGAIGWGIAGEVLFGPVGLLVGLLRGGRRNETTFVCKLRDGRKFLAVANSRVYSKMQLASLKSNFGSPSDSDHIPELSETEASPLPSNVITHPGSTEGYTVIATKIAVKKPFYKRRWARNGAIAGAAIGVIDSILSHPGMWRPAYLTPAIAGFLFGSILGPTVLGFLLGIAFGPRK
jgi:hypothetical protein